MTAGRSDRRTVQIRRKGRHSAPSQVEKVAQQAGKAAPAMAIAGVMVGLPTAGHALQATAKPLAAAAGLHQATKAGTDAATNQADVGSLNAKSVTVASATTAKHAAAATSTTYTVQSGDSLSTIASRFYHKAGDWQFLYTENHKTIADPNLITVGEKVIVPATVPAHYAVTSYTPKHSSPAAAPAAPVTETAAASSDSHTQSSGTQAADSDAAASSGAAQSSDAAQSSSGSATIGSTSGGGSVVVQSAGYGDYSCSGLEQLWEDAGGNASDAFMAAEIAMAESGGNPNAISPTDDFGLWQINGSNGSLATLDPSANARSAVTLSDDGSNWDAWTTYTSGAYYGKC